MLYKETEDNSLALTANKLSQPVKSNWWMTSYSGLVKQGNHHNDSSLELINLDVDSAEDKDDKELDLEPERTIFTFLAVRERVRFYTHCLKRLNLLNQLTAKKIHK